MQYAATWLDLGIITLSEINQRQILCDITFMQNQKIGTNDFSYKTKRLTDIENRFMVIKEEKEGVINQEFRIGRHKLPYIKYINDKHGELYSTFCNN